MNIEKMKEVLADEAFAKGLFELESAAEMQAALKKKCAELTEEEILAICEFFTKVKSGAFSSELSGEQGQNGELSDELLEQVAGGGFWGSVWKFLTEWLGHLGGC